VRVRERWSAGWAAEWRGGLRRSVSGPRVGALGLAEMAGGARWLGGSVGATARSVGVLTREPGCRGQAPSAPQARALIP